MTIMKAPDRWEVGMEVRYREDKDWAWAKGDTGFVCEVRDEYKDTPGNEYQVFYTTTPPCEGYPEGFGNFWTTPEDVEWIK